MIKIIVVEDEKIHQDNIKEVISKVVFKTEEDIKVEYFTKYNKTLQNIIKDDSIRKIYILDIELEGSISGIGIAKKIREIDWESELIFTTSHDKMFENHCFIEAFAHVH